MDKLKGRALKNGYMFEFDDKIMIVPFKAIIHFEEIHNQGHESDETRYALKSSSYWMDGCVEEKYENQFIEFKEAYLKWLDKE